MDLNELLALLDIDSASELEYFEQFSALMEEPQDIPCETLTALVEGLEPGVLSELIEGYFEEMMRFVPDGEDEIYTLLQNIATTLTSLSDSTEKDSARALAEELYKFRSWYLFDSVVSIKEVSDESEYETSLMEALTTYRVQNFTDEDYIFDFSDALDYKLDEYIVSLSSLAADSYDDDDYRDDDEDDDHDEDDDSDFSDDDDEEYDDDEDDEYDEDEDGDDEDED